MDYSPPPQEYHAEIPLAKAIKIPKKEDKKDLAYQELVCTDQDRSNIYELISTMAELNKMQLLFKRSHLKNIGAQIDHVHPLKFLGTIYSNEYLKSVMPNIYDDSFKWGELLDGVGSALTRESIKGKLDQYLEHFAQEVGSTTEDLQPYFQERNWEHMMIFLMHS